jgi:hypothetical protein
MIHGVLRGSTPHVSLKIYFPLRKNASTASFMDWVRLSYEVNWRLFPVIISYNKIYLEQRERRENE